MFVQVDTTLYRLDTTTHKPLWHFQPPGGAFIYAGQVVNNIYYLNVSGSGASSTLYALNVTNGKPLWQLNNVINTVGSYVITNDTIYVVVAKNDNLIIEALNSTSGVVQWEHPLGKATVNNAASKARLYTASAQAVYGTLITTTDTQLFALHTGDGHLLWQKDKGNTFNDSFWGLLVDGILVTLHDTNESVLQGYDAANGALLWSKPSGMILPTIAPRVLNDTIYVSGQSSNDRSVVDILAAFSAKDGALIWTYRSTEIGDASVTEKGVYITRSHKMTRDKDDLIALDPKTGMVRWTHQFQNETPRFPPSVQNDRIYLDLPGGVVQIVQAEDGKVLSSFKVNAPLATNTFVLIQVTD